MNDQPTSGNRWEPSSDSTPAAEQPVAEASAAPRRSGFGSRMRGFGRTAGARIGAFAIVVFVLGGAGGFGLAQLVSHDRSDSGAPAQRDGLPGDDHGRGFHGPRGTPPGQAPDEGTPGNQPGTSNDGLVGGSDDT